MVPLRNKSHLVTADSVGFLTGWREGGPSRLSEYRIGFTGLCSLGDQRASSTRLSDQGPPSHEFGRTVERTYRVRGRSTLTVRPQPAL